MESDIIFGDPGGLQNTINMYSADEHCYVYINAYFKVHVTSC